MHADLDDLLSVLAAQHAGDIPRSGRAQAAVAIVLWPARAGLHVLLIRRAVRKSDPWSGHIALPGGRRDSTDASLFETVQRETQEEVGLDLSQCSQLLGTLENVPAIAQGKHLPLDIVPYVFKLTEPQPFRLNDEVDEAFWVRLDELTSDRAKTQVSYDYGGQRVLLPAFEVEGKIVWGLTHRILTSLLQLLEKPDRTLTPSGAHDRKPLK